VPLTAPLLLGRCFLFYCPCFPVCLPEPDFPLRARREWLSFRLLPLSAVSVPPTLASSLLHAPPAQPFLHGPFPPQRHRSVSWSPLVPSAVPLCSLPPSCGTGPWKPVPATLPRICIPRRSSYITTIVAGAGRTRTLLPARFNQPLLPQLLSFTPLVSLDPCFRPVVWPGFPPAAASSCRPTPPSTALSPGLLALSAVGLPLSSRATSRSSLGPSFLCSVCQWFFAAPPSPVPPPRRGRLTWPSFAAAVSRPSRFRPFPPRVPLSYPSPPSRLHSVCPIDLIIALSRCFSPLVSSLLGIVIPALPSYYQSSQPCPRIHLHVDPPT